MEEKELIALALEARERAYAPYSHFLVGAALECEDGTVFTGCNAENASYGLSMCAERTAVFKAVSEGHRDFRRIAIAGSGDDFCWPCGACRQVLMEFAPEVEVIACSGTGHSQHAPLRSLLAHPFGGALEA